MPQLVWLVTGCSSGLGRQLVRTIIQRGDKVVATARRAETLDELAAEGAATLQLDTTADQEALNSKAIDAIGKYGHIDVVVHNAGTSQFGTIEDLDYETMLAQFNTNLFGPIKLTKAVLPHFRGRGEGVYVFIGSLAGWQAYPGNGAYGASKAALERVVDALHAELGVFGIKVLQIEAGGFKTRLTSSENLQYPPTQFWDQLYQQMTRVLTQRDFDGTVEKYAETLVDLVKSQGVADGKVLVPGAPHGTDDLVKKWNTRPPDQIPLSLPLGSDSLGIIKAKCEDYLKMMDHWESIIKSTDSGRV